MMKLIINSLRLGHESVNILDPCPEGGHNLVGNQTLKLKINNQVQSTMRT